MLEKIITTFIEIFLMSATGLAMLGIRLKVSKIFSISCIFVPIVLLIRYLYISNGVPFGTHTFIIGVFFALTLKVIGKQRILDAILASLLGLMLITWSEGIFLAPMLNYFQMDPVTLSLKPGILILAGLISNVLLIVGFMLSYIFKITFFDMNPIKEKEEI